MSWRLAHHWLRGYSDAMLGKAETPLAHHDANAYREGYRRGEATRLATSA